jgi:hypothetical protein
MDGGFDHGRPGKCLCLESTKISDGY